ncbi:hypothetical protein [Streptomyces neyagawaensis]|uniref:Uncharacterized protein n=1 Tax=Streptomyces neyagawaensis TaxID=42238 RepID=A0ABV3BBV2_9ACTN
MTDPRTGPALTAGSELMVIAQIEGTNVKPVLMDEGFRLLRDPLITGCVRR